MRKTIISFLMILLCVLCIDNTCFCAEETKEYPVIKFDRILRMQRLQEENEDLQVQYTQPIATIYVTDKIKINVTGIVRGVDSATNKPYHRVDYTITNKNLVSGQCFLAAYDANERLLFCKTQDLSAASANYITTRDGSVIDDISNVDHYKIMFWHGTSREPYRGAGLIPKSQIPAA